MSAEPTQTTFDPARAEAFGGRILDAINGGALAMMLSIGHRTGVFDVMAQFPPASSAAIAKEAGLSERYVREWLGAMVTGGVVEFDSAAETYHLPAEHAASLTREETYRNPDSMKDAQVRLAEVERDLDQKNREWESFA